MEKIDKIKLPWLKRFTDIFFSLVILIGLSPVLIILFLFLFLEYLFFKQARGPLFYCEQRISAGKPIKFCKIRTCKQQAYKEVKQKYGKISTARVEGDKKNFLKTGWMFKKIYLDEIPQIWSILKGDLSLVGPRPKPIHEYEEMSAEKQYTKKVIKCGLTGLYQSYKGHQTKGDYERDLEYIEFIKNHHGLRVFVFDLKIILRTIKVILEHKGI